MTHHRAFNSFYCFMIRFVKSRSKDLSKSPHQTRSRLFVSFPITAVDGRKRVEVEKEGIVSHIHVRPCMCPPTPLRIADASPLAFLLHHSQTTLDHPDGMLAFLLGHVQTRYEPHRVRPGGQ
jgi:hypothetical protein